MKLDLNFSPRTICPDLGSGLTVALVSIPEGMAYAIVAGVDPMYGLYKGMVTTVVAALAGSTNLMAVNALAEVGFTSVYNIVEGFEGDRVYDPGSEYHGKHMGNGWRILDSPGATTTIPI
jgi:MFS superfamily sulfate permease-like transporter